MRIDEAFYSSRFASYIEEQLNPDGITHRGHNRILSEAMDFRGKTGRPALPYRSEFMDKLERLAIAQQEREDYE